MHFSNKTSKEPEKKPQFKQYHLNYTIHLTPQLQKEKKNKTTKQLFEFIHMHLQQSAYMV